MTLKTVLGILSASTLLTAGCLNRKHLEDASAPGEAGPGVGHDTGGSLPTDATGPGQSEGGAGNPLDTASATPDGSTPIDVSPDLRSVLDGDMQADAPTDPIIQPTLDLPSDNRPVIDGALDLAADLQVTPDVSPDVPLGAEAGLDLPAAGCIIGGTSYTSGSFVGSGVTNTTNTCQICTPSETTTDWSNNDAATGIACGGCGGTASCVNMALTPCSKDTATYYQDVDGDGYGKSSVSVVACSAPAGYVQRCCDCNDSSSLYYPGISTCLGDATTQFTCQNDGTETTGTCADGCVGGRCRSFATVSVAGTVTCGDLQCSGGQGCAFSAAGFGGNVPACGANTSYISAACDGPNDCGSGQVCCWYTAPSDSNGDTQCITDDGSCPGSQLGYNRTLVCDPNQPVCPSTTTCQKLNAGYWLSLYVCK